MTTETLFSSTTPPVDAFNSSKIESENVLINTSNRNCPQKLQKSKPFLGPPFLKFGYYSIILCYCSLQTLQNYWMILSQFLSFYFCNRALGWLALSPVSPHVDVVSAHKFCSGYAVTYKFEYLFSFPEINLKEG